MISLICKNLRSKTKEQKKQNKKKNLLNKKNRLMIIRREGDRDMGEMGERICGENHSEVYTNV